MPLSKYSNRYLVVHTSFFASSRISITLLSKANKGANGKAATKQVMNPSWRTSRSEKE
jgi:hypothetical protein